MKTDFEHFSARVDEPASFRELRLEIEEFHHEYCNSLDSGRVMEWPDYFTADALYRITAKENAEGGMPVGLVYCEGRGMLRDRAKAVAETLMYAPRHLLHSVTNTRVISSADGRIMAQSNYLLYQTLVEGPTTLLQAGRYFDTFVREAGRLKLRARECVYDTELIANDIVYPV